MVSALDIAPRVFLDTHCEFCLHDEFHCVVDHRQSPVYTKVGTAEVWGG
jgi:hypothetical protein